MLLASTTVPPALVAQSALPGAPQLRALSAPPISPRRAFFYSAMVPGWGQAALDRRYTGAAFFLVEAVSLALMYRSADDLRLARAFQGDSVPIRFDVDASTGVLRRTSTGAPVVLEWQPSPYTADLVKTRKLQVEDWVAVVIFNHLISGADAFVAANLWDLPQHVSMRAFPVSGGAGVALSLRFR